MDIALINKVLVKKKQGKNNILLKNRQMPKCLETKNHTNVGLGYLCYPPEPFSSAINNINGTKIQ